MANIPNMRNIGGMLGQVRHMQNKLKQDKKQIDHKVFIGKAPNDLVTVKMTGNHQMQDIQISPKVLASKDQDMISDLIISATNSAIKSIQVTTNKVLGKYKSIF